MPPKAGKGKAPAPTHPVFTPSAPAPAPPQPPQPLPPLHRGLHTAILRCGGASRRFLVISSDVASRRLTAGTFTAPEGGSAVAEADVPSVVDLELRYVDASAREMPLEAATVQWLASNRRGCALVGTAAAGVFVVGDLAAPFLEAAGAAEGVPPCPQRAVPLAEAFAVADGLSLAGLRFIDGAVGEEHAVLLAVRASSGDAVVVGCGWWQSGALGRGAAAATRGLRTGRTPLREIREFSGEAPSAIWAVRHLTLVRARRGLLALGRLSARCVWDVPTLLLPAADGFVTAASATDTALFVECGDGRVLRLDGEAADTEDDDSCRMLRPIACVGADDSEAVGTRLHRLTCGAEHCLARCKATGAVFGCGRNSFQQMGRSAGSVGMPNAFAPIVAPPGVAAAAQMSHVEAAAYCSLLYFPDREQLAVLGGA